MHLGLWAIVASSNNRVAAIYGTQLTSGQIKFTYNDYSWLPKPEPEPLTLDTFLDLIRSPSAGEKKHIRDRRYKPRKSWKRIKERKPRRTIDYSSNAHNNPIQRW